MAPFQIIQFTLNQHRGLTYWSNRLDPRQLLSYGIRYSLPHHIYYLGGNINSHFKPLVPPYRSSMLVSFNPTSSKYTFPIFSLLSHTHHNSPKPYMAGSNSLIWFRKGLRIHDNPALQFAAKGSTYLYPVFVIDPHYMEPDPTAFSIGSTHAGLNRIRFLLESLVDLDANLKKLGSRLLVLKGDPTQVLIRCLKEVAFLLSIITTLIVFSLI